MREDCAGDASPRAPFELCGNRGVANRHAFPPLDTHDRSRNRRTIPDVEPGTPERVGSIPDAENVRSVEDRCTACRDSIPDRGRDHRMVERVGLEADAANRDWHAGNNPMPLVNGPPPDASPDGWRRVDRTRRPVPQAADMVRMRMREDDGMRRHALDFPEPVGSAVDHDVDASMRHER